MATFRCLCRGIMRATRLRGALRRWPCVSARRQVSTRSVGDVPRHTASGVWTASLSADDAGGDLLRRERASRLYRRRAAQAARSASSRHSVGACNAKWALPHAPEEGRIGNVVCAAPVCRSLAPVVWERRPAPSGYACKEGRVTTMRRAFRAPAVNCRLRTGTCVIRQFVERHQLN